MNKLIWKIIFWLEETIKMYNYVKKDKWYGCDYEYWKDTNAN